MKTVTSTTPSSSPERSKLMGIFFGILACLALVVLASCSFGFGAQKSEWYVDQKPEFLPQKALAGRYLSEGMIHDYTGKVVSRFKAEMVGDFGDGAGILSEHFVFSDGAEDRRSWNLIFLDDHNFVATASDIVGEARGKAVGNTLRMTYKLRLSEAAGGHVLSVTDWMYLTDEGTILNRSQMRKFGVKAAELVAVFKHRPLDEGEFGLRYKDNDEN